MAKAETAMTTATTLLDERRKYEAWLAALAARRGTTPEHVYTRVHADYERRLADVVAQLADKADALDARVGELAARADELDEEARRIGDERAEAELRAHVGELSEEDWGLAAQEADSR